MTIINDGLTYLPSIIGVPKKNFPNYKDYFERGDYSCITFYTPIRNNEKLKKQPLVSWSYRNKRSVFFGSNALLLVEGDETLSSNNIIYDPSIVLFDLQAFMNDLRNDNYNSLITDYSIMTPSEINYEFSENHVCPF